MPELDLRPLLMIPGPVEISPEVRAAHDGPPPGHLAPSLIEAYGLALERMRTIWDAPPSAQPFLIAGSGTLAMDMAAANLVEKGSRVLVINTGYFSDRMVEILRRYGAEVTSLGAEPGYAVPLSAVEIALQRESPQAVFVTHVDTSTGVRMPAQEVARLARTHGAMTVVDGVCATGAEALSMASGDVDVYLTGSQKALSLPSGLALLVVSERMLEARRKRSAPPPYYLDYLAWQPIMQAYEERGKAYFATPATNLVQAAPVAMAHILSDEFAGLKGINARTARNKHVAAAFSVAWQHLELSSICAHPEDRGVTMSALKYPARTGPELVNVIRAQGLVVAGGLHPKIKSTYFRVGHMGWMTTQPDLLVKAVRGVGDGLNAAGASVNVDKAVEAFKAYLESVPA